MVTVLAHGLEDKSENSKPRTLYTHYARQGSKNKIQEIYRSEMLVVQILYEAGKTLSLCLCVYVFGFVRFLWSNLT